MMRFVDNHKLKPRRVKLLESFDIIERLIRRNGSAFAVSVLQGHPTRQ